MGAQGGRSTGARGAAAGVVAALPPTPTQGVTWRAPSACSPRPPALPHPHAVVTWCAGNADLNPLYEDAHNPGGWCDMALAGSTAACRCIAIAGQAACPCGAPASSGQAACRASNPCCLPLPPPPRAVAASLLGILFVFVLATVLMNLVSGAAAGGWREGSRGAAVATGSQPGRSRPAGWLARAPRCAPERWSEAGPPRPLAPLPSPPCQLISIMTNTLDKAGG